MKPVRKAVFPVAGLGTRFLPATKASPKEMLAVVDKPLIQYAVEEAVASGITDLIFVTGRHKRAIEDHFDASPELEAELEAKGKLQLLDVVQNILPSNVNCIFVRQPVALGLGHAVLCARPAVGNEPFAVLLADDLIVGPTPITQQLVRTYRETDSTVLAVQDVPREQTKQYGIVAGPVVNERLSQVTTMVEKPQPEKAPSNLAVAGRYVLTPGVFDLLAKGQRGVGGEIQLSALKGDNITTRSASTPWYQGPTLVGCLETMEVRKQAGGKAAFPVQWVNRPNAGFRGFSGTLVSGQMALGDELRVTASGQTARLARLVTADGDLPVARAGDAVTLVLDREVDASRGDVVALAQEPLDMTDQFEATLVWLYQDEGIAGRNYDLKLTSQWTGASITGIKYRVDVNTLAREACKKLQLNDIAICNIATSRPVVFDTYAQSQALGSFILVDRFTHATVAAGMIRHSLRRAQNVHSQALSIARADRERLNGHQGKVIWFKRLS